MSSQIKVIHINKIKRNNSKENEPYYHVHKKDLFQQKDPDATFDPHMTYQEFANANNNSIYQMLIVYNKYNYNNSLIQIEVRQR